MGIFSGAFRPSVKIEKSVIIRTEKQEAMLRSGYKESFDHEIFPPDTVWAGHRSKVYHYSDICSNGEGDNDWQPLSEGEALRRGLHRCKKCDWHGAPVPAPLKRPGKPVKPVSHVKVKVIK